MSTLPRTGINARPSMAVVSKELKGELGELEDISKVVKDAEERVSTELKKNGSKALRGNDRQFAQALHSEADQLYHKGDYETALVLYHRAASLCRRDTSHEIAARRTAAAITAWNSSAKSLRKLFAKAKNESHLQVAVCPEIAAAKALTALKESPNPSTVSEVLWYFDTHKNLWRTTPSSATSKPLMNRTKMLKQLSVHAKATLKDLEQHFMQNDMKTAIKLAEELLTISAGLQSYRHQVAAHHFLALIYISIGRHDKAVKNASRMTIISKKSRNAVFISRSLVTLGKVHLSFGHFYAAARAWESLFNDLDESIPRAWIQHEIGRCYLETGKYKKALDMALGCLNDAEDADSKKWMLHGNLLCGQVLVKLGKYAEALEALKISAKITEEEGDTPTLSYVQDLIGQVSHALRKITFDRTTGSWLPGTAGIISKNPAPSTKSEPSEKTLVKSHELIKFVGKDDKIFNFEHKKIVEISQKVSYSEREECEGTGGMKASTKCSQGKASKGRSPGRDLKDTEGVSGNSTYRVKRSKESDVPSSSSSSSSLASSVDSDKDSTRTRIVRKASNELFDENSPKSIATESVESRKDEERSSLCGSSVTSLKTQHSNLTYVIKPDENDLANEQLMLDMEDRKEDQKSFDDQPGTSRTRVIDKYTSRSNLSKYVEEKIYTREEVQELLSRRENKKVNSAIDGIEENKGDWPGKLGLIRDELLEDEEKRDKLLEIIQQTLEMSNAACRSFEDIEDTCVSSFNPARSMDTIGEREVEFESSRSFEDDRTVDDGDVITGGMTYSDVTAHSLYRHSLPSSPRKRAEKVSFEGDRTLHGVH